MAINPYFNKLIDAYVDVETAGSTAPQQPVQLTTNEGRTYPTGQASSGSSGNMTMWMVGGAIGLGLIVFMATRS